jgi:hypothetical protein
VQARGVIEVPATGTALSAALEQSVAYATKQGQIALWDCSSRPYTLALYDERRRALRPLTDEQAAIILTRDAGVARQWRTWNARSGNQGSLILLDADRVSRVLNEPKEEPEDEEDVRGLP